MWPQIRIRRARKANAAGEQAFAQGDFGTAERDFTAALKRVGSKTATVPAAAEIVAAANLGLGRIRLAGNDFRSADRCFAHVRQLRPAAAEGYYWAGCTAAHLDDFSHAEWFLDAAILRDASLGRAYLQRAYVRLRRGREDLALADLGVAAQRHALDGKARVLTAALLLRRGNFSQAESFAAGIASEDPEGAMILGLARQRQDKVEAAFTAYEDAIGRGYRDDTVLLQHGVTAFRLGRFDASVNSWTALRDRHPERGDVDELLAAAHHARAVQRVAREDFSGAVEDLLAARPSRDSGEPDPAIVEAITELHLHAAARAIASDDRERARRHLSASGDPRASHYLALLSFLDGAPSDAKVFWQQTLDNTPGEPRARFGLAICALHQGTPAESRLRGLTGETTPDHIQRQAVHALAALNIRAGDWFGAFDELVPFVADDPWQVSVFAECLYRTGQYTELFALPENPWQTAARLRSGQMLETDEVSGDERVDREMTLALRDLAFAAAEQGDWAHAASLLHRVDKDSKPDGKPELIDGLIYGLGGYRSDALNLLSRAVRLEPTNHRTRHMLALMLLHTLSANEALPPETPSWESCIGVWMSVLHDETFWQDWRRGVEHRYSCVVSAKMMDNLRTNLRALIEQRLIAGGTDGALLLSREYEAARTLGGLGGLPLPASNGTRLVCGPLWMSELGLHQRLGQFALRLPSVRSKDIRRQFSQLGLATAQLTAGRPGEARNLAMDLRCPSCRSQAERTGATRAKRPLLCEQNCPDFDRYNPAFAGLADKFEALSADAVTLAVEALLEIGKTEIAKSEMNLTEVKKRWKEACVLATSSGSRDKVIERISSTALGRVDVLSRRRNWTDSIAVLDVALAVIGTEGRQERDLLSMRLARMLNARGVEAINRDSTKAEAARADLARAVKLAPHLVDPTRNLGVVLLEIAVGQLKAGNIAECLRLINESVTQLERGAAEHPGHKELREALQQSRTVRSTVLSALTGRVQRQRSW